jgi:Cys/Met metabolism PLP-dependent enzyme
MIVPLPGVSSTNPVYDGCHSRCAPFDERERSALCQRQAAHSHTSHFDDGLGGYQRGRPGSTRCHIESSVRAASGWAAHPAGGPSYHGAYGHGPRSRWADHRRRKARVALLRDIGSAHSDSNSTHLFLQRLATLALRIARLRKTRGRSSTTHSQLTPQEEATGVSDGYVRLSVGIEHVDDIIAISRSCRR